MTGQRPLALVTGAGGGIGAGVSRMLERRGYDVIAVDLTAPIVDRVTATLGPGSIGVVSDAADPEAVSALAARIRGEWAERLEVIVCNAGLISTDEVADAAPADLRDQLAVMLDSPVQLIAAAASVMAARGRGRILATVSMGGILALPGSAVYSAAKAGLRAFLTALSAEMRGTGVTVTGIYPSGVDTAMLRHEARDGGSMLNFVGRIFTVDDVVRAYERAMSSRRLEIYLPFADSIGARALAFAPQLGNRLLPLLDRLGRRGHRAYLARIDGGS
ncbi:SDR family oxidoreductase [Microbacterium sp. RURRCA19A]|uniref:SDR family NAD(P)-dependent oxidoreductase n=1 Tax=Microbacterium sp. RURRCA19A TaxID=1907391 RepID=UPI0009559CD2|nr:SDR family oxidoreductase [Microbacterium sp. RURRCA19A]SIR95615.1 Short-chain dehydrogenase [Microbacterium sp. RURRCA19A]